MRAKWKGIYRLEYEKQPEVNNIILQKRGDTITEERVGQKVRIEDGKGERVVKIEKGHVGMKYGTLVLTKKSAKYKKSK